MKIFDNEDPFVAFIISSPLNYLFSTNISRPTFATHFTNIY